MLWNGSGRMNLVYREMYAIMQRYSAARSHARWGAAAAVANGATAVLTA
jgi:hypothetical protein